MPRAKLTELGCVQRYQLSREERRRTKARAVGGDARGEGGGEAAAVCLFRNADSQAYWIIDTQERRS